MRILALANPDAWSSPIRELCSAPVSLLRCVRQARLKTGRCLRPIMGLRFEDRCLPMFAIWRSCMRCTLPHVEQVCIVRPSCHTPCHLQTSQRMAVAHNRPSSSNPRELFSDLKPRLPLPHPRLTGTASSVPPSSPSSPGACSSPPRAAAPPLRLCTRP